MKVLPALALLALLAPPAAADVFVLQNGEEVDGYLAGKSPRKEWLVNTPRGQRRFNESTVKEVRPSADPKADWPRYLAALAKKDAEGAAALGAWAKERGLPDEAREVFLRALSLRPDLAAAHQGLGHVKVGEEWLTPEEAEQRRRDEELRREMLETYERMLGAKPEVALSPHWRSVSFLGDGKSPDRLRDLEAAWTEAVRVLGSDPWKGRGLVVACEGQEQYFQWIEKDVKRLPGCTPPFVDFFRRATGMKWTEPPLLGRSDLPDRVAMHAANVHCSGHILLGNWKVRARQQPFWIEEGFGGWMEAQVLKSNTSYCYGVSKQGYGSTFRGVKSWEVEFPDWKALCKEAAARNEFLPLDQLDMLPQGEYSRREVGQAFSLVAFLLRERPAEKFRDYVEKVKNGEKSPGAFQAAYGETLESVEKDWKRFVQDAW